MKLKLKNKKNLPGTLITFCGLDGCGKSTLIQMAGQYLKEKGHPVFFTKEPTEVIRQSEMFRSFMDTPVHDQFDYRALSLACAADRIQHSHSTISTHLSSGYTVISDRYFYSCIANLYARGYKHDTWIYEIAKHISKPDISFFLDLDIKTAISRVRQREEEKYRYIDIDLQFKLRDEYLKIAKDVKGIIIPTNIKVEDSFLLVKEQLDCLFKEDTLN